MADATSMLFLYYYYREIRRSMRRQRVFRDRKNAFEMPDYIFIQLFRLNKSSVMEICDDLRNALEPKINRRTALNVEMKVLIALRFFATGSYQRAIGQDITLAVDQKTVSRCVISVSSAITSLLIRKYIQFPQSEAKQSSIKQKFMEYAQFPGIIGAIDCTLVAIIAPSEAGKYNEHLFMGRKGYHCLNIQLVCDSELKILNINAKFPGSTHDSFIWKSSALRQTLLLAYHQRKNGWLIGDSGYPLEPWLLTPILNSEESTPQSKYNKCHRKARACIERCIGLLKQRFRCLLKHRTLHYQPPTAAKIAISCAVLHNICLLYNLPTPSYENDIDDDNDDEDDEAVENENIDIISTRQNYRHLAQLVQTRLLQNYFL